MQVNHVELTISAAAKHQYPDTDWPELAFVGRSNVGKSSLLNKMINRKAMARTSGVPGKTQTLNFYNIEDQLYFVDVPGYGYAKVSKTARAKFATMIEEYLTSRKQLKGALLLVDARHAPTADDISMYQYLKYFHVKTLVVGTKVDKTSRAKRASVIKQIKTTLDLNQTDELILFSSETGEGKGPVWHWIEQTAGITGEDAHGAE